MSSTENMRNAVTEAFEQIEMTANEAFEKIDERSSQSAANLCDNAKKAADFTAEYNSLADKKRIRSLTTYENKRLSILKNNIDYYERLRDEEFASIKNQLDLGEISHEEYYSSLALMRDKYFQKGSDGWVKYTVQINKYNQSVVEEQKKEIESMLGEISERYGESCNEILSKQNAMREKLEGASDIYETVYFSMGNGDEEWLRLSNIDEDLQILKRYNDALLGVKKKAGRIFDSIGMDEEKNARMQSKFFEQITSLGVRKGTAFANHILNISDSELAEFITKWTEKIDYADLIAKSFYSDESKELIKNYSEEMVSALSEKFGEIPSSFFENGSQSAKQFKEGFLFALDEVMNSIDTEINSRLSMLLADSGASGGISNVTNNSSNYNIYGTTSPEQTALEIFKYDEKKRMLAG